MTNNDKFFLDFAKENINDPALSGSNWTSTPRYSDPVLSALGYSAPVQHFASWLKARFFCLWCDHDMLSSSNTHYFGYHADHTCGREGDLLTAWWNQGLSCTGCNIIKGDYAQKFFKLFQNNPDKLQPTKDNIDRVRREFKAYIAAERAKITKRFEEQERPFLLSLRQKLL